MTMLLLFIDGYTKPDVIRDGKRSDALSMKQQINA